MTRIYRVVECRNSRRQLRRNRIIQGVLNRSWLRLSPLAVGIQEKCFMVTCGSQIQGGLNNAGITTPHRTHWLATRGGTRRERRHPFNIEPGTRCRSCACDSQQRIGRMRRRAGAMSMAAGEYVSVHSQADTEQAELRARQCRRTIPAGLLYRQHGP